VSTEDSREKRDAWDLMDELLAEEEAERISALSPEEIEQEARKLGIDLQAAREMVERIARDVAMRVGPGEGRKTEPTPHGASGATPSPAAMWRAATAIADEVNATDRAELERIEALSPEALDEELRAGGIDPEEARQLGKRTVERFEAMQRAKGEKKNDPSES
jgi:hypothetical protein